MLRVLALNQHNLVGWYDQLYITTSHATYRPIYCSLDGAEFMAAIMLQVNY